MLHGQEAVLCRIAAFIGIANTARGAGVEFSPSPAKGQRKQKQKMKDMNRKRIDARRIRVEFGELLKEIQREASKAWRRAEG